MAHWYLWKELYCCHFCCGIGPVALCRGTLSVGLALGLYGLLRSLEALVLAASVGSFPGRLLRFVRFMGSFDAIASAWLRMLRCHCCAVLFDWLGTG